jgi:hypothetical protein
VDGLSPECLDHLVDLSVSGVGLDASEKLLKVVGV